MSSVTLEAIFKSTGAQQLANDVKTIGTESEKTATSVTKTGSAVDTMTKGTTTLGGKLKTLGTSFGGIVGSAGGLSLSLVSLQRQYRDLGDAQIAVDRTNLKVSKSQEAQKKAAAALTAAQDKYGLSSTQAAAATLDLSQANDKLSVDTLNAGEAQERFGDIQQNFWLGLIPTVTTAGGTILGVLSKIGGAEGIGGLVTKLKGISFTNLTSGITGLGSAAAGSVTGINGMTTATTGLGTAMKGLALSMLPVVVAVGGVALIMKGSTLLIHELVSLMKGDVLSAVESLEGMVSLMDKISQVIGPAGAGFAALSNLKFAGIGSMKDEIARVKESLKDVPQVIKQINPAIQKLDDDGQWLGKTIDNIAGQVTNLFNVTNDAAAALPLVGTELDAAAVGATAAEKSIDRLRLQFRGLTTQVQQMSIDPMLGKFFEWQNNPNPSAVRKITPTPLFDQPTLDFFAGEWGTGEGFKNFEKDSETAAKKIAEDHKTAAAEMQAAYEKAFDGTATGFQRLIDRYNETHKKQITQIGNSNEIGKIFDKVANVSKLLGDPAKWKTAVTKIVTEASKTLTGVARQQWLPAINFMLSPEAATMDPAAWQSAMVQLFPTEKDLGTLLAERTGGAFDIAGNQALSNATSAGQKLGKGMQTATVQFTQGTATQINEFMNKLFEKAKAAKPPVKITADNSDAITKIAKVKSDVAALTDKTVKATVQVQGLAEMAKALKNQAALQNKTVTHTIHYRTTGNVGAAAGVSGGVRLKGWQTGWQGTVNRPTLFMAGEAGRREHVYVGGNAKGGKGGGGGGGSIHHHSHIYLDGQKIAEVVSEHMGDGSSGYR